MSYAQLSPPVAQPKKRPKLLDKRDKARERDTIDRRERAKCHKRSGGQCEVRERRHLLGEPTKTYVVRCSFPARHNHHLRGGIGVRNIGESILAGHRLDTCETCHEEITGHVLQPIGPGRYDAATVVYERVE